MLSSADNVRADAVLQVGQTSESIEVTGEAAALKTESTEVSTTMEQNSWKICRCRLPVSEAECAMLSA
jgi:hypothetical protein